MGGMIEELAFMGDAAFHEGHASGTVFMAFGWRNLAMAP